ncbi:nicotinate-nucleotide--dimethylbenzimidazole phosphoribosyltransferase [uncultured Jatrophihabitans sp.]|uniref:nicotinate-nucleotide--dimethylbenzimidazole phosphoribosyltransferase n=1 Tax=uncultured Jatrophihabitans sp. TaxID=1610747 RepID=UPI0035CBD12F
MDDSPIDLFSVGDDVEWTDAESAAGVRSLAATIGGRLGELVEWLAGVQGQLPVQAPKRARCVVLGPAPESVVALADELGVHVRDLVLDDDATAEHAFAVGLASADDEVDSGADLLIVADPDDSIASALVVAVLTGAEPVALLPRGAAATDTDAWIARADALRIGRRRLTELRTDPSALLGALGHPRMAATVALIMRAAARRTAVVLDGTAAVAAALLCHDVQARAGRWWQLADVGADPVQRHAAAELALRPLLDLAVAHGDGTAGLLAVPVLRAAAGLAAGTDR